MEKQPLNKCCSKEQLEIKTFVRSYWKAHPDEYKKLMDEAVWYNFFDKSCLKVPETARAIRSIVGNRFPGIVKMGDKKLVELIFL